MHLDETAHIMGSADFFSICNMEQRRMLAFASERVVLKPGEVLFRAGDVTDGAYVLISGTLISAPLIAGGDAKKIGEAIEIHQPGTVIGELALIAKHPRRANVSAKSAAELLLVPRASFSKLVEQFPQIAQRVSAKIKNDLGNYVAAIETVKPKFEK